MKRLLVSISFLFCSFCCLGQSIYHVFPTNHQSTPGKHTGDGSLNSPWDLQTALSNKHNTIKAGAIIYLHEGTYNGRYISNLKSNGSKITVSAFENDKVILNGNVNSEIRSVLEVNGGNVIFKNFEITFLGDFLRHVNDKNFKHITGINHLNGEDCEFINLKIHNVPGTALGSWKRTGGTKIQHCIIFNNGYIGKQRGHGVGIYVQNQSDKIRLIENNIIFNNYYKGVEVWDASDRSTFEYVKNVTLRKNTIFNNGVILNKHWANILIASNDNGGLNIAKNISVTDNVLYHNTDFLNDANNFGDGVSLALGYNKNAPVENVTVKNNIIIGKNNALNILYAKDLVFKNNTVYTGYIHFNKSVLKSLESNKWDFQSNNYYSRRSNFFRVLNYKDFEIDQWQNLFKIDTQSKRKHIRNFEAEEVLSIVKFNNNSFRITLFNKQGHSVNVDFSDYKIKKGTGYTIRNIENDSIITSGSVSESLKVTFSMSTYNQTVDNFGVYSIEFNEESKRKRKNFFRRLFGWLF